MSRDPYSPQTQEQAQAQAMADAERGVDAYLRAALRHAPDAQAEPSAEVDAFIHVRARQALGQARKVAPPSTLRQTWITCRTWLDKLAQPAPAAVFASLVMGTAIALLWHGEVPQEAVPDAPLEQAQNPAATVAIVANAEVSAPTVPAQQAAAQATKKAAQQTRQPAVERRAGLADSPAPTVAQAAEPTSKVNEATAAAEPVPATAPLVATGNPAPPSPPAAFSAAAPPQVTSARASLPSPMASPAPLATRPQSTPLQRALTALPPTSAMHAALAQLQASAQYRWQAVPRFAAQAEDVLVRSAAGELLGTLRIQETRVWWQTASPQTDPTAWQASLEAAVLERLRDALQNPDTPKKE